MLVRRKMDGREALFQDAKRDPWERRECVVRIGEAFQQGPIDSTKWTRTELVQVVGTEEFERVEEEGAEAGYYYYRRPVDVARKKAYEAEPHKFRVGPQDW